MPDHYSFEERDLALFELHGLVIEASLSILRLNELIRLSGVRQETLSKTMRESSPRSNIEARKAFRNKMAGHHNKKYIVTEPDGTKHSICGLKQFCSSNDLKYSGVKASLKANRTYKGWVIKHA